MPRSSGEKIDHRLAGDRMTLRPRAAG